MKLNKRLFIGMVAFSIVSNTILGYQLNSKAGAYKTMRAVARDYRQMFYNAKDATTCTLFTIANKEEYARCQQYVEDLLADYKEDIEIVWNDPSKYFNNK